MTEKRERSWRNGLVPLASAGCLLAVVLLQVDNWPAFLQVDYHGRVREQIAQGAIPEALALLNRASLLDEAALESVGRVPFPGALANDRKKDAELRAWLAERIVAELGTGKSLGPEERELLELATENAELLVALDPGTARSHLLLGLVYLQRGHDTGAPIEFQLAARHLGSALQLDPDNERAQNALRLAMVHVRNFYR